MASVANLLTMANKTVHLTTKYWQLNGVLTVGCILYLIFPFVLQYPRSSLWEESLYLQLFGLGLWAVLHSLKCVTYWRCLRERGREVSGDFCCLPELWRETEAGCWRHGCLSVRRSGYRHSRSTAPDQTLTAPTNRKRKAKAWQMHFW